jgi:hypothetical protein
MADQQITDYTQVTVPAVTDEFLCQQSGVTLKITADQIIGNIANLDAASALDGTELTVCQQSGVNKYITLEDLATYIISEM